MAARAIRDSKTGGQKRLTEYAEKNSEKRDANILIFGYVEGNGESFPALV